MPATEPWAERVGTELVQERQRPEVLQARCRRKELKVLAPWVDTSVAGSSGQVWCLPTGLPTGMGPLLRAHVTL